MRKMAAVNPTLEDILLFASPFIRGDFSFLGARGEKLTAVQLVGGDWAIVGVWSYDFYR